MLKLYQLPGCPYALRTRLALGEKNLEFETVVIDRKNKPAEVLEVSPSGRTPVLIDGSVRLRESLVINEYLEDRFPTPALMPRDAAARAEVRLLIGEVEDLHEAMHDFVVEHMTKPEGQRDPKVLEEGRDAWKEAMEAWNQRLSGKTYLVGDALTLADLTLYPVMSLARRLGGLDLPSTWVHLQAWLTRIEGRPGLQKAIAFAQSARA